MNEIFMSGVALGLPLADLSRAKGAEVAVAPDMPDHSRML
jgi:hypothetical protein